MGIADLISFAEHISGALTTDFALPRAFCQEFKNPVHVKILHMEFFRIVKKFGEALGTGLVFTSSGGIVLALVLYRLVQFLLQLQIVMAICGVCPTGVPWFRSTLAFLLGERGGLSLIVTPWALRQRLNGLSACRVGSPKGAPLSARNAPMKPQRNIT